MFFSVWSRAVDIGAREATLLGLLTSTHPPGQSLVRTPGAWAELAEFAGRQGMSGILVEKVVALGLHAPSSFLTRLRAGARAIAAANLPMSFELERVVTVLTEAGVVVMLLKGAALRQSVYRRPDLRPMGDLDLMIPPDQVTKAVDTLLSAGCKRGRPLLCDDFFPRFHYELELITDTPHPVRIDLHARPLRPLRLARIMPDNAFWSGAESVPIGGGLAWVPRSEFMFLHLAAHAAFHGCDRLLWLYDLWRYAQTYADRLDWDLISDRARAWRIVLPALRAIRRTTHHFGPFCPQGLTQDLQSAKATWADRLTLWRAPKDAASPLVHVLVTSVCTPGIGFRLRYLFAHLRPSRQHLAEVYRFRHPGWPAVAYLWRWVRRGAGAATGLITLPHLLLRCFGRGLRFWPSWSKEIEVRRSQTHGRGVFARRAFEAGARIGRYRARKTDAMSPNIVFRILRNGTRQRLELQPPFRYLNHSEAPNAAISPASDVVRALRAIPRGTEITIDYGVESRWCRECEIDHWAPRSAGRESDRASPVECLA